VICAGWSCRSGDGRLLNFSRWRPSAILEVGNFNCPYPSEVQNASSYQILCKSVKALRRYGRFRFLKMAAVRHLGFLKVGNFNCPYPSEGQNASSRQILCRSVKPMRRYGRFRFSRWRPSAVLDLLYACLDHPRSVFWWSRSLCKIWFESVQ